MRRTFLLLLTAASLGWAQEPKAAVKKAPAAPPAAPAPVVEREPGLYASINTTMGTIVCKLFEK